MPNVLTLLVRISLIQVLGNKLASPLTACFDSFFVAMLSPLLKPLLTPNGLFSSSLRLFRGYSRLYHTYLRSGISFPSLKINCLCCSSFDVI